MAPTRTRSGQPTENYWGQDLNEVREAFERRQRAHHLPKSLGRKAPAKQ